MPHDAATAGRPRALLRRAPVAFGLLLGCLLAVAGCRPTPEAEEVAEEEVLEADEVPEALILAETLTEEVQSDVNRGDWSEAERNAGRLRELSDSLAWTRAQPAELALFKESVVALISALRERDALAADTLANRANRAVAWILARYSPRVPPEVDLMAVAARDAVYRAALGQWDGVTAAVSELRSYYEKIRERVRGRDPVLDRQVVARIETLRDAAAARDLTELRQAAGAILVSIDAIKVTY